MLQKREASNRDSLSNLQYELMKERSTTEVLAFALARVLRETRYAVPGQPQPSRQCADTGGVNDGGMDDLQAQLQRMSVHESPATNARAAVVQQSITAAQRIMEMPTSGLSARALFTVPSSSFL